VLTVSGWLFTIAAAKSIDQQKAWQVVAQRVGIGRMISPPFRDLLTSRWGSTSRQNRSMFFKHG
jgi:hypothetical protein